MLTKRIFISHSSADKDQFVRPLVALIGPDRVEYDEETFEDARRNEEEILAALERSTHFVVLISDISLDSKWVARELAEARRRINERRLESIIAVRISDQVALTDSRIPEWLVEDYNIVQITNVRKIADLIRLRIDESIQLARASQGLKTEVFTGRNALLEDFENRMASVTDPPPKLIVASGWNDVGRATFLERAFVKTNLVRSELFCPIVPLGEDCSIEDLILRLGELGITSQVSAPEVTKLSLAQKLELLRDIIFSIRKSRYLPIICDDRCIFDAGGRPAKWIAESVASLEDRPVLGITTTRRPELKNNESLRRSCYTIAIPELSVKERKTLFVTLLRKMNVELGADDLKSFSVLFSGYPEQVYYAADFVQELGARRTLMERSREITEFADTRAKAVLEEFKGDQISSDILLLLSRFEYVDLDLLVRLVDHPECAAKISILIDKGACNLLGLDGQFVRLNDLARPVIRRIAPKALSWERQKTLKAKVREAARHPGDFDNGFLAYALPEVLADKNVESAESWILPSYTISMVKRLSNQSSKIDRAIELCDRLLERGQLESRIELSARYFLCICLAKKRDTRFHRELQVVRTVDLPTAHFLKGFWLRRGGRLDEAQKEIDKVKDEPRFRDRVEVETLTMLITKEHYDEAFDLAYEKFVLKNMNPYIIRLCFIATMNSSSWQDRVDVLQDLLAAYDNCIGEKVESFRLLSEAEFAAIVQNDSVQSFNLTDQAIEEEPDARYGYETGCKCAIHFHDHEKWCYYFEGFCRFEKAMSRINFMRMSIWDVAFKGDKRRVDLLMDGKLAQLGPEDLVARFRAHVHDWMVADEQQRAH